MPTLLELVDTHYRGLESADIDLAVKPFATDVTLSFPDGPMAGVEALRAVVTTFVTAFPGMRLDRRHTWVDGETAVVELVFNGTQSGPLITPAGEVPPSGKSVTFSLVDVFTAQDGQVTEHRVYWDNVSFLSQLGLMPGMADA